ncbi:MAG: large-conductance mechanosensitive channel protein MscL [Planctomycetaceae bacterium]|nr:large-conductance mechanosensitive channel protein MscL [Planctomycetaceae bacterium]
MKKCIALFNVWHNIQIMKIWQEFKQFAIKGNAIDMAVAIIIGTSFNKVVNSLVNDVIMPPIGFVLGGVDFKNLQVILKPETLTAANDKLPAVALRYGMFINTLIDFLIVAFTMFMVVKLMNKILTARAKNISKEEKK